MRNIITGLLSASLVFALAGSASAYAAKRHHDARNYNSPSAIAERQRHRRTFDDTQYYEHDLSTFCWHAGVVGSIQS